MVEKIIMTIMVAQAKTASLDHDEVVFGKASERVSLDISISNAMVARLKRRIRNLPLEGISGARVPTMPRGKRSER